MVNKIRAIVRKELKSYFNSPIAYIVMGIFLIVMSILYLGYNRYTAFHIAELRLFFNYIPNVFILVIPAITMRIWAEEKRSGTEEVLLTLPFKEYELVIGKFIAPLILLFIMLLLTLSVPFSLSLLGTFEWGQILGQYIGVFFFGATCISVGLFISSLTKNQIIAFFATALILFFFIVAPEINTLISFPPVIKGVINWISFRYHFETLSKGLIETKDLMFFILMSILFLYCNIKVLVFKKWQ
jgi:ABC-2 type transport system permease protein